MWDEYWQDRGSPWEFDSGPPRNRSWLRIFAEAPNYRGLGLSLTGDEEYRWHFGPMFYRGRLGDNQVRVLVVGQEGAQDESLSHRSFTGGTGARMQHLLAHLGFDRSYLFLNTFVYPIFGQYNGILPTLAQHPGSPIARHRRELFDYVTARNDVHLAVAVGAAAKESLASWVHSHGGTADPDHLDDADATVIAPNLRMVGVLHPGGASKGGAVTKIKASFMAAITQVETWAGDHPGWLPPDPGMTRPPASSYTYGATPIPFRDFPFGVPWRLGRGATSSNRRDGQLSIQLFSGNGSYNNDGDNVSYSGSNTGTIDGYSASEGDRAWEPPRVGRDFDKGPTASMARLMSGGTSGFAWPDFTTLGLKCASSLGYGPIYRGRLNNPSLLVLADQESHDDLFTMRAATGQGGQRLQAFLTAAGVTDRYAIIRVLPVDTLEDDQATVRTVVDHPSVRALYREIIRRADPTVLVVCGPLAARLTDHVTPTGVPVVEMKGARQSGFATSWRAALGTLSGLTYDKDVTDPTFGFHGEREQIPRKDLPFGTLRWQATSGDRAAQADIDGEVSFDYFKIRMPGWAANLQPEPLNAAETSAVDLLSSL